MNGSTEVGMSSLLQSDIWGSKASNTPFGVRK